MLRWSRAAAAAVMIPFAAVLAAAPAEAAPRKISVTVGRSCVAPAPGVSNACRIQDTVPGAGLDGADLTWEVTLLFSPQWLVQFQAFSEAGAECQYPVRVWGAVSTPDGDERAFKATEGFTLPWTPAQEPTLTLTVERLRIDTAGTC